MSSSLGQGGMGHIPRTQLGAPFPSNAAENGLSIDPATGRVVLGNNTGATTATLLSDREIPMSGNSFRFIQAASRMFEVDPGNQVWGLGDLDGLVNSNFILIQGGSPAMDMQIGDGTATGIFSILADAPGNASIQLSITGPAASINYEADAINNDVSINDGSAMGFFFDFAADLFTVGAFGAGNLTRMAIDDAGQLIALVAANGIRTSSATFMIRSSVAYNNGAAAAAGTLNNAPAAGNPTKWIPVDDNGTTRHIPAW